VRGEPDVICMGLGMGLSSFSLTSQRSGSGQLPEIMVREFFGL